MPVPRAVFPSPSLERLGGERPGVADARRLLLAGVEKPAVLSEHDFRGGRCFEPAELDPGVAPDQRLAEREVSLK